MGTLGCINDMMRRDKENRELRKAGKERLNETRNRLIDLNKKGHSSHLSLEQLEEIRTPAIRTMPNMINFILKSWWVSASSFSYSLKKPIRILIFVIPTWNNLKNR